MVRGREWKLVHYLGLAEGELYHLPADPGERTNLWSSADPEPVAQKARLPQTLLEWRLRGGPARPAPGAGALLSPAPASVRPLQRAAAWRAPVRRASEAPGAVIEGAAGHRLLRREPLLQAGLHVHQAVSQEVEQQEVGEQLALGAVRGRTPRRRAGRGGPPGVEGQAVPVRAPPDQGPRAQQHRQVGEEAGAGVVEVDQGHQLPVPEEDVPAVGVVVHDAPREVALARPPGALSNASRWLAAVLRQGGQGVLSGAIPRWPTKRRKPSTRRRESDPERSLGWGSTRSRVRLCRRAMVAPRLRHRPPRVERGGAAVVPLNVGVEDGRQAPNAPWGGAVAAGQGGDGGEPVPPQVAQQRQLPQHLLRGRDPVARRTRRSPSASSSRTRLHHQQGGRHGQAPGRPPEAGQEVLHLLPRPVLRRPVPVQSISSPAVCQPAARCCPLPVAAQPPPAGAAAQQGGPSRYQASTSRRRARNTPSLRLTERESSRLDKEPFSQPSSAAEASGGEQPAPAAGGTPASPAGTARPPGAPSGPTAGSAPPAPPSRAGPGRRFRSGA